MECKADFLISHKIRRKISFLTACPSQGQACGDIDVSFGNTFRAQFFCDNGKRKHIKILVQGLVGDIFLVFFSNQVIFAVIDKQFLSE